VDNLGRLGNPEEVLLVDILEEVEHLVDNPVEELPEDILVVEQLHTEADSNLAVGKLGPVQGSLVVQGGFDIQHKGCTPRAWGCRAGRAWASQRLGWLGRVGDREHLHKDWQQLAVLTEELNCQCWMQLH